MEIIDAFIEFIEYIRELYFRENLEQPQQKALIRHIKNPMVFPLDAPERDMLIWFHNDIRRNVMLLLEQYDRDRAKRILRELLNYVITDYDFVDSLLKQQIEPLVGQVFNINSFSLTPYLRL
jgi:hypothetical protein